MDKTAAMCMDGYDIPHFYGWGLLTPAHEELPFPELRSNPSGTEVLLMPRGRGGCGYAVDREALEKSCDILRLYGKAGDLSRIEIDDEHATDLNVGLLALWINGPHADMEDLVLDLGRRLNFLRQDYLLGRNEDMGEAIGGAGLSTIGSTEYASTETRHSRFCSLCNFTKIVSCKTLYWTLLDYFTYVVRIKLMQTEDPESEAFRMLGFGGVSEEDKQTHIAAESDKLSKLIEDSRTPPVSDHADASAPSSSC